MARPPKAPSFEQSTIAADFETQHGTLQSSYDERVDANEIPEEFVPQKSSRTFAVMALAAVCVLLLIGWLVHKG